MKKFYLFIIAQAFVFGVIAQQSILQKQDNFRGREVKNDIPQQFYASPQTPTTNSFYIDYFVVEAAGYAANFKSYIWNMNARYSWPADSVDKNSYPGYKYIIVAFDSLLDAEQGSSYPAVGDKVTSMTVDSIIAIIGQENNSGTDDTLIVKIVGVTANYPNTTIYWKDTLVIKSNAPLSASNDWMMAKRVTWAPNFTKVMSKFAVKLEYYGDKKDTCGFISGFGFGGKCSSNGAPLAVPTAFSYINKNLTANSFVVREDLASYGLLPQSGGADVFFDCDKNGKFDSGVDGVSEMQNIRISSYVTVTTDVGIKENQFVNGVMLSQNHPNPANKLTNIRYSLTKPAKVSFEIYDITGRKLTTLNEGSQSAGKHSISVDASKLAKGIYFYTLRADEVSLTKRMVITE